MCFEDVLRVYIYTVVISYFIDSLQNVFNGNRPQVSMVYRLINHVGCWKNIRLSKS